MQQDIANLKCRFVVRVKARIERKKTKTQLDFDVIGINFSPGNNVKKKNSTVGKVVCPWVRSGD